MKKVLLTALLIGGICSTASAQIKIGNKKIDTKKAVQAGVDAAQAITLSDADIAKLCREYMEWMDAHNPLTDENSEYGQRLQKNGRTHYGSRRNACEFRCIRSNRRKCLCLWRW